MIGMTYLGLKSDDIENIYNSAVEDYSTLESMLSISILPGNVRTNSMKTKVNYTKGLDTILS